MKRWMTSQVLAWISLAFALLAVLLLTGCSTTDPNAATPEDRAAFALAWSQQTEADKDNACIILAVQGEHGVALNATKMDRPHVFAAILADTCEKEGR